ncbi:Galactose transporter [Pleurostoma richardsiae]|uniref:Galactose transporter n=1 Tax=Pleurostoma richardsiae TaxID=41990 RepID=A0AA38RTG1_9PEZI|nr:Galactose transporter [Pleurostoma richardsiae]
MATTQQPSGVMAGELSDTDREAAPNVASGMSTPPDFEKQGGGSNEPVRVVNLRVIIMGLLVSMGGFIFGYEGGAISGYTQMTDFRARFGNSYDNTGALTLDKVRTGCMVALLCAGCLVGSLISAPFADKFGRKYCIAAWNIIYIVGNIVQITATDKWYQVPIGRLIAGFGIGALSVLTPMYQSETAPRKARSVLVSAYQLFITLGIFTAYCINYGTEVINGPAQWRITMGCGFIAPTIMAIGMLFMRESPRWDFRRGNETEAAQTLALVSKVPVDHVEVQHELTEIRTKLEAENAGGEQKWYEIFTGPAMLRRTLLGIALQALQQLTGANFFFYYGTQIFNAVGISNSYITSMILGAVNFGSTIVGLWIGSRFGRRICLIVAGFWMFACFMIFASLGSFVLYPDDNPNDPNARTNSGAGGAMIAFACLFIFGFATTWGPLVWAIVGEMFPSRYRARCMALCTASNWLWNFLISFFTPFITGAINYRYGYVFAACCFVGAVITFFFVIESQGRSLEEVDTMYVLGVVPWKSASWTPLDDPVNTDHLHLAPGARAFAKKENAGAAGTDQLESAGVKNEDAGPSNSQLP